MSEMIDRVAKVLYVADGYKLGVPGVDAAWAADRENVRKRYRAMAAAAIEATSAPTVKPLVWSQSKVFGYMKRRGFSPFGEFVAFTIDGLSADEIARKEAGAQADYEDLVRSALV